MVERPNSNSKILRSTGAALEAFITYLDTLNWGPGNRDSSGYLSFLRAGSLGVDADTAMAEVARRIQQAGGSVTSSKLQHQLRRAYEHVQANLGSGKPVVPRQKLAFSPEKLRKLAARLPELDVDWIRKRSPVPLETVDAAKFLELLYAPGEKIIAFTKYRSQGQMVYDVGTTGQPMLPAGSSEGVWFLANPVDGEFHPNPREEGKLSRRSEESITAWRYLVAESDTVQAHEWLSVLAQLPLKIVAIYTSGGKSIHALVRVDASTKAEWDSMRDQLRPILITLGADPQALTAVRLTRLPGAMRGERLQELLFLNPNSDGTPIQELPESSDDVTA